VAPKPPATHPFADDPDSVEHDGAHRCAECGLPRINQRHTLPDVPGQAEARRRVGEREEDQ
jgi:hypothetical protein